MPKDPAAACLDEALGRLRRNSGVEDKLATLRLLVEYWHGPILPEDGLPAAVLSGVTLPRPLALWYGWAGRRTPIMSGQNFFYQPGASSGQLLQDGRLHFQIENQACHFWSTSAEGDDPPVFSRDSAGSPWRAEKVSLSEHLILNAIFEATMSAEFRACSASLRELKLNAIVEQLPALTIGPWLWCDMHFYAGGGAFMTASLVGEEDDRRYFSVWLGAKREGALDFIAPLIGDEWEMAEF